MTLFEDRRLWPSVTHVVLDYRFTLVGKKRLTRLASSEVFQNLTALTLNMVSAPGLVRILDACGVFTRLKHLRVTKLSYDAFDAVLDSPNLSHLDSFWVEPYGYRQSTSLAECPWLGSVGELRLGRMWNMAQWALARLELPPILAQALKSRPRSGQLPPDPG